ncbi:MAG: nucleoside-diphosphate kinase [Candidatus Hadarchaeales archaeon]
MSERTLVVIKPDGVRKGLVDEIKRRIEGAGLRITAEMVTRLSRGTAEKLYEPHRGRDFFGPLVEFMISGDVVVMRVEGDRAISRMREISGNTDPRLAPENTIRGRFGTTVRENVIHSSDSPETAERELAIFFRGK